MVYLHVKYSRQRILYYNVEYSLSYVLALVVVSVAMFLNNRKLIYCMNMNDQMLIDYVRRMINTGARKIFLPMHLVNNASHEALAEVRRLCQFNRVEMEIRG